MKIFIDSNVFLDAFMVRRGLSAAPQRVLDACAGLDVKGYTDAIAFANATYFLLRHPVDSVSLLRSVVASFEIIPHSNEDFSAALSAGFSDLEDAYHAVAAQKVRSMRYIITRNVKDFKKSKVPAITAEDWVEKYS